MSNFNELEAYRQMYRIRKVEEAIIERYPAGQMKTPVHLSVGQEAAAVGTMMALPEGSLVYASHRSHAPYLAKGGSLDAMVAELYGKPDGCTGGYGGSMYLTDPRCGFMGSFAVVGDCVSVAVGAALALQRQKSQAVAVAYFGDSVPETGQFWEALNLAALWKLPILFVMEDNGYATQTALKYRQGSKFPSKPFREKVLDRYADGCEAVFRTVNSSLAIERPAFVSIFTYRYKAHVGMEDDWDMGYRSLEDEGQWHMDRDPVDLLGAKIEGEHGQHAMKKIWSAVNTEVREAFEKVGDRS